MTILDSNVWIALLSEGDSNHKQACVIFDTIRGEIALPEYIVLEVCTVLTLMSSKKLALKFLEFAQDNQDVQLLSSDQHVFGAILKHYVASGPIKLSFVDLALVYFSRGYLVVTFDKQLKRFLAKRHA